LAFPENPYHRLVKDYKLVRDSINDPVADARLAASVFGDQWASFITIGNSKEDILSFYRYCFEENSRSSLQSSGLNDVFYCAWRQAGVRKRSLLHFQNHSKGKACESATAMVSLKYLCILTSGRLLPTVLPG